MKNNELIMNTIHMCIKAKKYTYGETMLYDIKANHVKIVIIATDAGEATKKKIIDKCNFYKLRYLVYFTKEELNYIFQKKLSAFGIKDDNLAKKFIDNLNKGGIDDGK